MRRFVTRRRFLFMAGGVAAVGAAGAYPIGEARWLRLVSCRIPLPRLPKAFEGLRVALLSDTHHSSSVSIDFVRKAAELARAEKPDLVLLGGDYTAQRSQFIAPCIEALASLEAPLGTYAVLGNHDHWRKTNLLREEIKRRAIVELTNRGIWLERSGERLRLAGVGDLWEDRQDLTAALGDIRPDEGALLLSHNPDYAEILDSSSVDLVLSGHTHGGQVVLPVVGSPVIPSSYGMKYAGGLVRGPRCLVYVTRGIGTVGVPVRFGCRPEVNIITLVRGAA